MLFLWLNKTPPQWNSPLSVQEGFTKFWRYFIPPFWTQKGINLKNFIFKNWWWCGPFALCSYFLHLWHESPKTDTLSEIWAPFTFSPMANNIWVNEYTNGEMAEYQQRVDNTYGVEWKRRLCRVLHFPFNSMTKHKNTLEDTLVIDIKRCDQKIYQFKHNHSSMKHRLLLLNMCMERNTYFGLKCQLRIIRLMRT